MPRFEFTSPGAAFTDELTRILAERKIEERQRMLDSLSQNADARAQAQAELNKRQVEASMQADLVRQEQEKVRAGQETARHNTDMLNFRTQGMKMGDDPRKFGLSEEDISLGSSLGRFRGTPVTEGEFSLGAPQMNYSFVGSPDEIKEQRLTGKNMAALNKLVTELRASGKNDLADAIQRSGALNDGKISDSLQAYLGPPTPTSIFSQNTGKFTAGPSMPPGTQVVTHTRPPREPRDPSDDWRESSMVNPDGTPLLFQPGTGNTKPVGGGAKRRDPNEDAIGIPANVGDALRDTFVDLREKTSYWTKETNINQQDLDGYRHVAHQAINSARYVSHTTKQLAHLFVDNKAEFDKQKMSTPMSEADAQELSLLLMQIAPVGIRPILQKYPAGKPSAVNVPSRLEQLLGNRVDPADIG